MKMTLAQGGSKSCAFYDRKDPEWARMWAALRALDEEVDEPDPDCLEVWQYMGTWNLSEPIGGEPNWAHQFRHRHHPLTHTREYLNIPVSRHAHLELQREEASLRVEEQQRQQRLQQRRIDEADIGGVVDAMGNVTSDADPGL